MNNESPNKSVNNIPSNQGSNLGGTAQRIGEQAQNHGKDLAHKASDFVGEIGDTLDDARMKFNEARDVVVDKSKSAARTTDDYVSANPWKSVGIASGVALLVGMIMRRK